MSQFVRGGGQCRARPARVLAAVFATLTGACTEPMIVYPTDGGVDGSSSACTAADEDCRADNSPIDGVDASIPIVVTPPADQTVWASPYRNSYALRMRRYGTFGSGQQATRVAIESIFKAKINTDTSAKRVTLSLEEMCSEQMVLTPSGGASAVTESVIFPNNIPPTEYRLTGPASDWSGGKVAPSLIGYQERVAGCVPGKDADGQAYQVWLESKKCQCVSEEASASPPKTQTDCRVDDLDKDRQPGISLRVSGRAIGTDTVVIRDESEIAHGHFDPSLKHTALLDFRAEYVQLVCANRSCETAPLIPCRMEQNTIDFNVISDGISGQVAWGCREILQAVKDKADFFPNVPHVFPEGDCY